MKKRIIALLLTLILAISVVPISVSSAEISDFNDVKEGTWYYDAVSYVVENGFMNGTTADTFEPNGIMTRAMLVTVLGRMAGADISRYTDSSFDDVDPASISWAYGYIEWAAENSIVNGTGEGMFSPYSPVTREQAATIFCRYAESLGYTVDGFDENCIKRFGDVSDVSEFAYAPFLWASYFGIINGTGTVQGAPMLNPKGNATRAAVAVIIKGFLNTRFDTSTPVGTLTIAGNDITEYKIIYDSESKENADFLNEYIEKTIGVKLEEALDTEEPISDKEILIGKTNREGAEGGIEEIDRSGIDEQSYYVKVTDGRLILSAAESSRKSTSVWYGIKRFLKTAIGWRFYNFGSYLDGFRNSVDVPEGYGLNEQVDVVYSLPMWGGGLDSSVTTDSGVWSGVCYGKDGSFNGSRVYYDNESSFSHGNRVHTIPCLCQDWRVKDENGNPVLDEDGNYVYMTNKQIRNKVEEGYQIGYELFKASDPCLTNEENIQNIIIGIRAHCGTKKGKPGWFYVNQGDGMDFCRCENCMQVYREEGSFSGVYVRLINRICEELEDEYPNICFVTTAYKHTQIAPRVTKLHKNGIIMVCTDTWCTSHAIDDPDCPRNAVIKESLDRWAKVCTGGHMFTWDYWSYCRVNLTPDIIQRARDYCYLASIGADGYVIQAKNLMFGELRAYIINMYTEDHYTDFADCDAEINEFLKHFYGYGWTYIREYIDFTQKLLENHCTCVWAESNDQFVSAEDYFENKDYLNSLLDKAYNLASYDWQKRMIEILTLQMDYSEILHTYDAYYLNGTGQEMNAYSASVNALIAKANRLGAKSLISSDALNSNGTWNGKDPAYWPPTYD